MSINGNIVVKHHKILVLTDFYCAACEKQKRYIQGPSGISELDCATTKTDTAKRSISIGRESLQVFFCTRGLGVLPGSTVRG